MRLYERVIRPLVFRGDAERMHDRSIRALQWTGRSTFLRERLKRRFRVDDPRLRTTVAGISCLNPIGLAAGYDKNGVAAAGLAALGFGFIEIGSISADPSPGNPQPRLFRLPAQQAIIVNYGLPNTGVAAVTEQLDNTSLDVPLGINLVNTNRLRDEGEEEILDDFVRAAAITKNRANYLVFNLSCPNTPSGRECFAEPRLTRHLLQLLSELDISVPVFLKVSPRGGVTAIDALLEAADDFSFVSGFIFNTPGGKPDQLDLTEREKERMPGAVTGPIHAELMNEAIANLYRLMDRSRYHIIGVGGVFTAEDAYQKIRLGASLVQLYTALIYRGPAVVRDINLGLLELLERDGLQHIREAVGVDVE